MKVSIVGRNGRTWVQPVGSWILGGLQIHTFKDLRDLNQTSSYLESSLLCFHQYLHLKDIRSFLGISSNVELCTHWALMIITGRCCQSLVIVTGYHHKGSMIVASEDIQWKPWLWPVAGDHWWPLTTVVDGYGCSLLAKAVARRVWPLSW